jgi:hypothetical protein
MKILKALSTAACATLALFFVGVAQADPISGTLCHISEAQSQLTTATSACLGSSLTFTINSDFVNMNVAGPTPTVGAFLASDPNFVLGSDPGSLAGTPLDTCTGWNGTACTNQTTAVGTYMVLTGFTDVDNGNKFTITHDDGILFRIGAFTFPGTDFSAGPTSAVSQTGTYGGTSGNNIGYALYYSSCCDGGETLIGHPDQTIVRPTPEPATLALLGLGLSGLAIVRRRKRT